MKCQAWRHGQARPHREPRSEKGQYASRLLGTPHCTTPHHTTLHHITPNTAVIPGLFPHNLQARDRAQNPAGR